MEVDVPRDAWRWMYRGKCGGGCIEGSVEVGVSREVWRGMYRGKCGGGCIEGSVEVDVSRDVWRWMYRGKCGGGCIEGSVEVGVSREVWRWMIRGKCGGGCIEGSRKRSNTYELPFRLAEPRISTCLTKKQTTITMIIITIIKHIPTLLMCHCKELFARAMNLLSVVLVSCTLCDLLLMVGAI